MITVKKSGGLLQITVSGVFDFDASRSMLLQCKGLVQSRVDIHLEQITSCHSSAIGALSLLADRFPGGVNIHLNQCSEEVHQLFDSGFVDRFINRLRTLPVSDVSTGTEPAG